MKDKETEEALEAYREAARQMLGCLGIMMRINLMV